MATCAEIRSGVLAFYKAKDPSVTEDTTFAAMHRPPMKVVEDGTRLALRYSCNPTPRQIAGCAKIRALSQLLCDTRINPKGVLSVAITHFAKPTATKKMSDALMKKIKSASTGK